MKAKLVCFVVLAFVGLPIFAHRLDEYLQAILVSIAQNHVQASMRLIPGVAVSSAVIAAIDTNSDGVFSAIEQREYAQEVLRDISLQVDGRAVQMRLEYVSFPAPAEMKQGLGEIHIGFAADLPAGPSRRILVVENHHQTPISVYLMNCLEPEDGKIRIASQARNSNQSSYRIDYTESDVLQGASQPRGRSSVANAAANFTGVPAMFRLGMSHIAEGTDHLLFLVALLLPAPLLAVRSRWAAPAAVRESLAQIVRVVSAFTVGHSLTLVLGAWGGLSLLQRPVEVLIAFSILISAAHALRPLFAGREPVVAAFFGLIHGWAFSATLQNLGAGSWQRLASVLGFNLGIEAMQLLVIGAMLPSLILLSRTAAYPLFRVAGALIAGCVSLGWIAERLFGVESSIDLAVSDAARRGAWIAAGLLGISLFVWMRHAAHARQPSHG